MQDSLFEKSLHEANEFFVQPNPARSVFILTISLIAAFFLSRYLARAIIKVAQFVALRADNTADEVKAIKLRRVETYLSIAVAVVRVLVVVVVGVFAWQLLSPTARNNSSVTAIGASAVFIVIAGATINPLLRDITSGSSMIAENWFGIGDHVKIEPFWDVSGVVERVTLRSTKLRRLNGEVVWLHNQHIQGAHVTPNGIRTMAVEIFVRDTDKGLELVKNIASSIPTGSSMLTKKIKVAMPEAWGEDMWRIVVTGHTPPGREWLIEDFFVNSLIEHDKASKLPVLAMKPFARYADPEAEKNFRRAVRGAQSV